MYSEHNRLQKLILNIIDWNIKNLPDNTKEMQLAKRNEELTEFEEADAEHKILEAVDVLITEIGLLRYDHRRLNCWLAILEYLPDEFIDELENKYRILLQRKYEVVNGVYRHTK